MAEHSSGVGIIAVLLVVLIGAVSGVGYMLYVQHQHTLKLEAQAEARKQVREDLEEAALELELDL